MEALNEADRTASKVMVATVGELRSFLAPFDDECPLLPEQYGIGVFYYEIDRECNGRIRFGNN